MTLRVPKDATAATAGRLLAELPVLDLTIEDPPIEDVIGRVFAGQCGDPVMRSGLIALSAYMRTSIATMIQYRGEIILWAVWGVIYPAVAMAMWAAAVKGSTSGDIKRHGSARFRSLFPADDDRRASQRRVGHFRDGLSGAHRRDVASSPATRAADLAESGRQHRVQNRDARAAHPDLGDRRVDRPPSFHFLARSVFVRSDCGDSGVGASLPLELHRGVRAPSG